MQSEYQDIIHQFTIFDHGLDVWKNFQSLHKYLEKKSEEPYDKPMPKWALLYKDKILEKCKNKLEIIENYLIYHDCGKPFCLIVDEEGRRHFPNHAEVSYQTFLQYHQDYDIANLIRKDMLCHTTKPKDFELIKNDEDIEILLLSALAAIHSNAIMFGGLDSDSFKIKFKNLEKLGERILK